SFTHSVHKSTKFARQVLDSERWATAHYRNCKACGCVPTGRAVLCIQEVGRREAVVEHGSSLLDSIADFCRRSGIAESTFGRRAVNDGKFVSRLRNGARIT